MIYLSASSEFDISITEQVEIGDAWISTAEKYNVGMDIGFLPFHGNAAGVAKFISIPSAVRSLMIAVFGFLPVAF